MIGKTVRREQGLKDPLLVEVMQRMGLDKVPLYEAASDRRKAYSAEIRAMTPDRDGPVNPAGRPLEDPAAMAAEIKRRAEALGAELVGIVRLTPTMIDKDVDLPHDYAVCIGVHEDYDTVLQDPSLVEEEAQRAYRDVARIATLLARQIRDEFGHAALAHHNGGTAIQAIPAMYRAGFGELGKHGSLINPTYGASFRPSFVTTTLPLAEDSPLVFGVQDTCLKCNVCTNNCPGDAIPREFIETEGVKRWLTDVAKCYPYSRLREEYCHLCVDVCPYNADNHRDTYKTFMKGRKTDGYKSPKKRAD